MRQYIKYLLFTLIQLFYLSFGVAQTVEKEGIKASESSGCAPLRVSFEFENESEEYFWSFGNGQSSKAGSPTILFENSGSFYVKLIYKKENNTFDTLLIEDFIKVYPKPEARYSADKLAICTNQSISFTNLSVNADTYEWNFGDGNTSNMENPTHIYSKPGEYTVSLKATSAGGCSSRSVENIGVQVTDAEAFTIASSSKTACNLSSAINFTLNTPVAVQSVNWNFGDGTTATGETIDHQFNRTGKFLVSAEVVDVHGCTLSVKSPDSITVYNTLIPSIVHTNTSICENQKITFSVDQKLEGEYAWSVAGKNSTKKTFEVGFEHSGKYMVTLNYTAPNGCTSVIEKTIAVDLLSFPEVSFTEVPKTSCIGSTIHLENFTSDIISTSWIINDSVIAGNSIDYTFDDSGDYTIKALVEFKNGCSEEFTISDDLRVQANYTDVMLSSFGACASASIDFVLANKDVKDVRWYAEDQLIGQAEEIKHNFQVPGEYHIKVSYTNAFGCEITHHLEQSVIIYDARVLLDEPDTIYSCTFTEVHFNGDIGESFWEWDFGDGSTSTEKNPTHVYEQAGTYKVSLTTNNKFGCRTTIDNYNIIELASIEPEFTYSTKKGESCGEFTAYFTTDLKAGYDAFWYFQESLIGSGSNASASFVSPSDVNITLRLQHKESNCSKYKSKVIKTPWDPCEIEIPDLPESDQSDGPFGTHTFSSCTKPYTISLENPVSEAAYFEWRFDDGSTSNEEHDVTFMEPGSYTIDYYAKMNDDSTILVEDYITVNLQESIVDFNYSIQASCDTYKIYLVPDNPDFKYYRWKLNSKSVNLEEDNSISVSKAGLYQVSLFAENQEQCEATMIKNIIVGNIDKEFNYQNKLCADQSLKIENNLVGFDSFKWDLGNGEVKYTKDLNYTFSTSGVYEVTLIGIDNEGCEHEFAMPRPVFVSNPTARFSMNKSAGCGSLKVQFENKSEGAERYIWDFGNEITSEEKNPVVRFTAGTYEISLTAIHGECKSTYSYPNAIVVDSLASDFEFTQLSDCLPVEVNFNNLSVNAHSYLWDFGDGNTSTEENPTHTYTTVPKRAVRLKVFTEDGCFVLSKKRINPIFKADFKVDNQIVCNGNQVQFEAKSDQIDAYRWDFGDGSSSSEPNPTHFYAEPGNYTVSLIATNNSGCVDTVAYKDYIKVYELEAAFSIVGSREKQCVPFAVDFANNSKGANAYFWDFGDGNSSTATNPQHVFKTAGEFTVSLIVMNEIGCSDTFSIVDAVKASGPETNFSVSDSVVCLPNSVQFTDQSLEAVSWEWFFGDGYTSTEQNPEHLYTEPGFYSVTLIATNADGCSQSYTMDSIRAVTTPYPQFELQTSGECFPVTLNVQNNSRNLAEATLLWDFGDGNTSTEMNPNYTYYTPGEYQVSLTIKNDGHCERTYVSPDKVLVRDTAYIKEANVKRLMIDNHVRIEIENPGLTSLSHYEVYKKIGDSIYFHQNLPADATLFTDMECNPSSYPHGYIFRAINFCTDTAAVENLTKYTSIHLTETTTQARGAEVYYSSSLRWTQNTGFEFDYYAVLRKEKNNKQWYEIAQLDKQLLSFTDQEELCPGVYEYKIAAVANGEAVNASNKIEKEFSGEWIQSQVASKVTSTVIEDNKIYTEWQVPSKGKSLIAYYEVWRSVNNQDFTLYDQVSEQYYIDSDAQVDVNTYKYKIKIVNTCQLETNYSEQGANLVVEKKTKFERHELSWKPYDGWGGNVSSYLIQRKNENGEWETIEIVPPTQNSVIIKDINSKGGNK